jgi:broad specificity phosphatase PhoE
VRKLLLVKHSLPEIDPRVPSLGWRLSEEGCRRCLPLADELAIHQPAVVVASREPKATETARLVADRLGTPLEVAEGLHENDRSGFAFLPAEEWEAAFARFFARPDGVIIGTESAHQAHQRFAAAIERVLERYPEDTVAVVAHGTVIALFVSRAVGVEPFPLWRRLGLPSVVVMSLPELDLCEVVVEVVGGWRE